MPSPHMPITWFHWTVSHAQWDGGFIRFLPSSSSSFACNGGGHFLQHFEHGFLLEPFTLRNP
jgi:hypothetical protein